MSAPSIFPTLDRPRCSKLLAYPIGAEALSRALDGVPQHGDLACNFFASNPHHEQNKRQEIYVMAFTYEKVTRSFHHSQASAESGVFDPRWRIHIHAVPAEVRAMVKQQLVDDILHNHVRPWLIKTANMTGRTGAAAFILHYDRAEDRIMTEARESFLPEQPI